MDQLEFFREATLRICGNLEIEKGLRACIGFLSKHMPADRIYLERHDHGPGEMRPLARANTEVCERLDMLVHLSDEARVSVEQTRQAIRTGNIPPVIVVNRPQQEPLTRCFLEALGEPSSSTMSLLLIIEGQVNGAVILLAEGNDRFDDDHARLFASLREPFFVAMSNALKHREILGLKDLLADDNRFLHGELRRLAGDNIIGANFGLKEVMHKVNQVAPLDSPVLLLGETGVGKDVIANAIHYSSPRKNGPFITVNCGAIPDTLIDSELFGHEKGAFTGAVSQKRGRFERADKGTIFLDEIAELPLLSQTRLLHVLQNKTIERVGGTKTLNLDIRVIAATNQDLKERIKTNQFREDLWFRLNVFPITIPPLRRRKSDIPSLLQHFLSLKSKQLKLPDIPSISPDALKTLMDYHWPGNVRELENIVERTLILDRKGPLNFDHLKEDQAEGDGHLTEEPDDIVNLDEVDMRHIRKILNRTEGKIHGPGGAADLLGINASTLRNRMKKLGIVYKRN